MQRLTLCFTLLLLFASFACFQAKTYDNPLIPDFNAPDPGVLKLDDGTYVVATTSNLNIEKDLFPIHASKDLVNWKLVGHVFPREHQQPSWSSGKDYWAPEIHKLNETNFVVYYVSRDTTGILCIGAAFANTPYGPFKDIGHPLIRNETIGMIDATFFRDTDGKAYLSWKEDGNDKGWPTPIFIRQIADDGKTFIGPRIELIRNTLIWEGALVEAPWIIKRGGYYYLFYSSNAYYNDKYNVGVARATNVTGPYIKFPLPILKTSTDADVKWIGPGHCSVVPALNDPSQFIIIYHAWPAGKTEANNKRELMMDTLTWNDKFGWPVPRTPSQTPQVVP